MMTGSDEKEAKKLLARQRREAVIQGIVAGKSTWKLAAELGISHTRVIHISRETRSEQEAITMSEPHQHNQAIAQEQLRAAVLKGLLAGKTQSDIARELGVTRNTVCKFVVEIKDEWREDNKETVEGWVALLQRRYEEALIPLWPLVAVGDPKSTELFIKLSTELRRMLGLDKAVKLEISGEVEANAADFDRRINQILHARREFPDLDPKDDEEPEEATDAAGS